MSQSQSSNPRRRPLNRASLPPLSISSPSASTAPDHDHPCRRFHALGLRKGATFHAPSTPPSEESDPILNLPTLLRRSPTSPRSLEDVVAAGEKRMAAVLGTLERNISGLGSKTSPSSSPSRNKSALPSADEDLPVPRGILVARIPPADPMDIDSTDSRQQKKPTRNHHSSDSGLGSSITGTEPAMSVMKQEVTEDISPLLRGAKETLGLPAQSAVTRSFSSTGSSRRHAPTLSAYSFKKIEQYVLRPLYTDKRLKPFHALVKAVPTLVVKDTIRCLRDVEKHFIHTAFRYAVSKTSYINFCEYAVQCIHTTVPHLPERDQRLPADRPYTNGYFLDLVEQIRQYGAMINAARQARASGARRESDANNLDYSSGEELVLEGGLGKDGRPVQLVRKKRDQKISLETNAPYEEKPAVPALKRSLSAQSCDDAAMRSMARRKKNEPPLNINKKCSHCDKIFRRPCDLTKHEKTHSRPWKCSEVGCKYSEVGWPTEKERDRHMNDKHSSTPRLYKCAFEPCAYTSKRESNCKQHMEKAHGWTYVRSKNNGKANSTRLSSAQPTPQTPALNTPGMTDMPTPVSGPITSPYDSPYHQAPSVQATPQHGFNNDFAAGTPQNLPIEDFPLFPEASNTNWAAYSPYNAPIDFSDFHQTLHGRDPNEQLPSLELQPPSVSSGSTSGEGVTPPANFLESPTFFDGSTYEIDWDSIDNEFLSLNAQAILNTPDPIHHVQGLHTGYHSGGPPVTAPGKVQSLSPAGQGNLMLYSPAIHDGDDEGFHDAYEPIQKPSRDFTLFDSSMRKGGRQQETYNAMFPSLQSVGDQYRDQPSDLMTMDVDQYVGHEY